MGIIGIIKRDTRSLDYSSPTRTAFLRNLIMYDLPHLRMMSHYLRRIVFICVGATVIVCMLPMRKVLINMELFVLQLLVYSCCI